MEPIEPSGITNSMSEVSAHNVVQAGTVHGGLRIYQSFAGAPAPLSRQILDSDFRPLVEERTRDFVGREFVFDRIGRTMRDSTFPSGYILVTGEPGIGKTSVIAQLVKTYGWVHHFNVAASGIVSTAHFLANVCAQLIVRYGLDHHELPPRATEDGGFLKRLLTEAAAASREPVVLLVDAIDEARSDVATNQLCLPESMPPGVFAIVSSRDRSWYRLRTESLRHISIADDDPANLADLRAYVERYLSTHLDVMNERLARLKMSPTDFVSTMTERSEGNFLYVVHVLNAIVDGSSLLERLGAADQLPLGLREYYRFHWQTMEMSNPNRFAALYQPILLHFAVAGEAVSVTAIARWTGLSETDVSQVITAWREFLNEEPGSAGERRYRIYHKSFLDYLEEEVGLRETRLALTEKLFAGIPTDNQPRKRRWRRTR